MNAIAFLGEWGLRSTALILSGTLLLLVLRVKDPAIRLAAWTAMLLGSLAIPLLTVALPKAPVPVAAVRMADTAAPAAIHVEWHTQAAAVSRIDWRIAAAWLYALVAGGLLLRIGAGVAVSRRLLRASRSTGREFLESDAVPAPVVLGVVRPAIVLPADWREWDAAKLEAVLAHERSHVRRHDPAVQLLSAIHRALVWHSPLSWFLHKRIVRAAEDASDDAAVAATRDRATYAEVLLGFMQGRSVSLGVGMARYGRPEDRIHRILDGTAVSRGVTRWILAAILALGAPMAYLAAAAAPQAVPPAPPAPPAAPAAPASPAAAASPASPATPASPQPPTPTAPPQQSRSIRRYIIVFGDNTMSGSWNSNDSDNPDTLRRRFGNRFAWFRKTDGSEFVTTDVGVMEELERTMLPQKAVNQAQGLVNDEQSKVNEMQSKVNSLQGEVNALQSEVNKRQDLVNRIQSAANEGDKDALIRQLQAALQQLRDGKADVDQKSVNRRQSDVNAEQAKVDDAQHKVNEMQGRVNDEQRKVSAKFNLQIEEVFNSAVGRRLMQRLM